MIPVTSGQAPFHQLQLLLLSPLLSVLRLLTLCFWRSSDDRGALISFRLSLEAAVK